MDKDTPEDTQADSQRKTDSFRAKQQAWANKYQKHKSSDELSWKEIKQKLNDNPLPAAILILLIFWGATAAIDRKATDSFPVTKTKQEKFNSAATGTEIRLRRDTRDFKYHSASATFNSEGGITAYVEFSAINGFGGYSRATGVGKCSSEGSDCVIADIITH